MRHSREKMLDQENVDLHGQLTEALEKQDQLAATVESLQERYTEVMGMLQDAEEELSNFRQRGNLYLRTTSSDSLYDSLASELEASDSGFYNTPMISARSDSRQSQPSQLHSEMEKLSGGHVSGPLSLGAELSAQLSDPQFLPFGETAPTPLKEGEILEVPSAIMIELAAKRSRSRSRPKTLKKEPEPEMLPEPVKVEPEEVIPIEIETPTPLAPLATSTPLVSQRGVSRIVDDETASTSSTLSKSTSSESLANYEGPKMGQPGKPGTRDLDFGIRRLQLRKQIEMDYQKYRRERGLAPSKPQGSSKARLSKMVAQLATRRNLLPQWSFAQEAQEKLIANDPFAKFLASTDPLRVCQPFRKLTQVGLFGALTNGESAGTTHGILTRRNVSEHLSAPSTPTSSPSHLPSTPLRHLVYTNGQSLKSVDETDPSGTCPPEDPTPVRPSRLMGAVSGIFTRSASVRLPKNTLALSRDNSPTSLSSAKYDIVARGSIL
uniref:Milton domain-containing protein n=1 Tax=Steinernema glaseri TaxID=37863 RepID=A0A1I7ZUM6_9BILA